MKTTDPINKPNRTSYVEIFVNLRISRCHCFSVINFNSLLCQLDIFKDFKFFQGTEFQLTFHVGFSVASNVAPGLFTGYQLFTPAGNYHPVALQPTHATHQMMAPCMSHAAAPCPGGIHSPFGTPGTPQYINPNTASPPNTSPQHILEMQLQQHQQNLQASLLESPQNEYGAPYGLTAIPIATTNQYIPQNFIQSQSSISVSHTAQSP